MIPTQRRVAIVTGSSRGIGRMTAVCLARAGYAVVINYHEREDEAAAALAEVDARSEGLSVQADVTDPAHVHRLVEATVERYGRIDVLVNNAGMNRSSMFHRMRDEDWHAVIDVNLHGVYHCCREVINHMRNAGGGRIISISSIVAEAGSIGTTNYAASKAALIGFSKSLALENALKGITVNVICPGYIERTGMLAEVPDGTREQILHNIPMNRFGTPEEVGELVCYLASPAAGYITGQVININGGLYM